MKRTFVSLLTASVFAVGLLTGCASEPRSSHAESSAVWDHHGTLAELLQASDVVVRARVIERARAEGIDYGSSRSKLLYYTDTRVGVDKYLKGTGASTLTVRQMGNADIEGASFADLPILSPGTQVLLFLNDITSDPKNLTGQPLFMIVSPEGLYQVVDNRLITVALGTEVTNTADKTAADVFERIVEAAAR